MVFPEDPVWQAAYAGLGGNAERACQNVRFRSWGMEGLLLRCCRKNMPWLRRIYILLAGESQGEYLAAKLQGTAEPEVRLVYHREFMPEHLLPCFNVCTIEMFLHRIPGLSEHFIYSNDDFFPLSPLLPSDFFRAAEPHGPLLPCQHFVEKPFPSKPNIFHRFVKNGLDMVAADFGRRFTQTWLRGAHSMQPMLLRTVRKVCDRHAVRISGSFTTSRRPENFNQYIFPFWQHLSGQYIDYVPCHAYLGPGMSTEEVVRYLRGEDPGICCINDNEGIADWQERAEAVKRELAERLKS